MKRGGHLPVEPEPAPALTVENTGRLPAKGIKLSALVPRSRLKLINSEFANDLYHLSPIFPTIEQVKSPPQDWYDSSLVVMEVPMLELGKKDTHLALQRQIIRLLAARGPSVHMIVTPRVGGGSRG